MKTYFMYEVKTKTLISNVFTMQLICTFVFAFANSRFSHEADHFCFAFPLQKKNFFRLNETYLLFQLVLRAVEMVLSVQWDRVVVEREVV